jgi:uncharacterized membrane protein HdeD (DUF308 family)
VRESGLAHETVVVVRLLAPNWWPFAVRGIDALAFGVLELTRPRLTASVDRGVGDGIRRRR